MSQAFKIGLVAGTVMLCGCGGARISEQRMMYAEPKPENCDIKVVNVATATLGLSTEHELLGSVVYQTSDSGVDPFSPELLSELRPRFCRLGGDEVSLGMSAGAQGGSSILYQVLRKRTPDAAPTTPVPPG